MTTSNIRQLKCCGHHLFRVLAILCALLLLVGCQTSSSAPAVGPKTADVVINGETITCELAIDNEARSKGMSGREEFPAGGGLLFVFPKPAIQSFWMYDCKVDIDVIFLDSLGYVTATHEMTTQPRRDGESEQAYRQRLTNYTSRFPAHFAIELPAGSIDRLDVQVEDRVKLDRKRLKAMAE